MILLQAALLAFGVCAAAALLVDFGFVMLSRVQMQNAVDAAAAEGARPGGDAAGRQRAKEMAEMAFGNPAPRYAGVAFGAGPALDADPDSRLLSYDPDNLTYRPALKLNEANEPGGDMVRGEYLRGGAAVEEADYSRGDFVAGGTGDAFLVRMRRTNREVYAADDPSRSAGPALPLLFGRGALIGDSDGPSLRRDGIAVRAAAIAEARRIQTVPAAADPGRRPGLLGIALTLASWESLGFGETLQAYANPATGVVSASSSATGELGRLIDPASAVSLGYPLSADAGAAGGRGYIAIYANEVTAGVSRVIGYGRAAFERGLEGTVTVVKDARQEATFFTPARPAVRPPEVSAGEWEQILNLNSLLYPADQPKNGLYRVSLVR